MFRALTFLFVLACTSAFSHLITDDNKLAEPLVAILETLEIPSDSSLTTVAEKLREKCHQSGDRWTFEHRFDHQRETLMPLLEDLGCFATVRASKKHYNYAVILGALRPAVQKRIDFLVEEWKRGIRFDEVVLLTGKRALRPSENCPNLQSETEMMTLVWNETPMPAELKSVRLTIVNSPPAPGRDRATTESTVFAWLEMDPTPGHTLVVSSQPYVGYQESILKARLPISFSIETIGPEGGQNLPTSVLMDNLSKWLIWTLKPCPASCKSNL